MAFSDEVQTMLDEQQDTFGDSITYRSITPTRNTTTMTTAQTVANYTVTAIRGERRVIQQPDPVPNEEEVQYEIEAGDLTTAGLTVDPKCGDQIIDESIERPIVQVDEVAHLKVWRLLTRRALKRIDSTA